VDCLTPKELQQDRKSSGLRIVAKPALASLLVWAILWLSTLAVSVEHSTFHQSDEASGGHACGICLFAHGQVIGADPAPASTCNVAKWVGFLAPAEVRAPAAFDYRLAPSRAPPLASSSPTVVG
jgi:hypothetical protein